jgi:osmotically-inducible protein OsmY
MTIELTSHIPMVRRRRRRRRAQIAAAFAAGVAAGGGLLYFVDSVSGRRRRKTSSDRAAGSLRRAWRRTVRAGRGVRATAYGTTQRVRHRTEVPKDLDDVTLAHKVESEIFRDPNVPKGQINVNAQRGVVQLRGEVPTADMLSDLVDRTRKVQGVREVESLLHLPGIPAHMHQ